MDNFSRIAVINTGWSDDYQSSEVVGGFSYLASGVGHEKYNFLPGPNGRFYGYAPPLGKHQSPPMPVEADGWLVFVVSKRPGSKGLYLVGWYEDATFLRDYLPRPDADDFGRDSSGGKFLYALYSDVARCIPLSLRDKKISNDHVRRSYAYLRGNGNSEPWRDALARQLLKLREEFIERLATSDSDEQDLPPQFNVDPARRREIEKKAEAAVEAHFAGWTCVNRAVEKCGYDLLFTNPRTGEELHVEVKGTARDVPHFFMTQREYLYGKKLSANDPKSKVKRDKQPPLWRLAVVHSIDAQPTVNIHSFDEMESTFDIVPYAHHATIKAS